MSAARGAQLMRNFRLSPQSTQEELQSAYHKLAKLYHPDVAKGNDTEEQFKKITHDYQEALELHKQGLWPKSQGVAPGFGGAAASAGGYTVPKASQHWHQAHWQEQGMAGDAETWKQYANSAREEREARQKQETPQTAAQRIRNVVLAAGGGLALVGLFLYTRQPADDLYARRKQEAPRQSAEEAAEFARKNSRTARAVGAGSFSYPVASPTSLVVELVAEELPPPDQKPTPPNSESHNVGEKIVENKQAAALVSNSTRVTPVAPQNQVPEEASWALRRKASDGLPHLAQAPVEPDGAPIVRKKSRNRSDEEPGSYYARRTVKGSSVRVSSTDVYVSPQDSTKVQPEEGLGKTFSDLVYVAKGYRPSEGKHDPDASAQQSAQQR